VCSQGVIQPNCSEHLLSKQWIYSVQADKPPSLVQSHPRLQHCHHRTAGQETAQSYGWSRCTPGASVLQEGSVCNPVPFSLLYSPFRYWEATLRSPRSLLSPRMHSPSSQPVLVRDAFHSSGHFCGPPLDALQQVRVPPVLRTPHEVSQQSRGAGSPPLPCWPRCFGWSLGYIWFSGLWGHSAVSCLTSEQGCRQPLLHSCNLHCSLCAVSAHTLPTLYCQDHERKEMRAKLKCSSRKQSGKPERKKCKRTARVQRTCKKSRKCKTVQKREEKSLLEQCNWGKTIKRTTDTHQLTSHLRNVFLITAVCNRGNHTLQAW